VRDSGFVNVLCGSEYIFAMVVDEKQHLYKSLNITMGPVNVLDIIEAKLNDTGALEYVGVVEEGIPHKEFFYYKDMDAWKAICQKASEHRDSCIIQGLTTPKGTNSGVVAIAYEEGFAPLEIFGNVVQEVPAE
jgi:hypothetical protein